MTSEIPPYQAIDIALGANLTGSNREMFGPRPGYVVTFPDSELSAEFFEGSDDDAVAWAAGLAPRSKWPDSIYPRKCWIHEAKMIYGEICHRRFWTPR